MERGRTLAGRVGVGPEDEFGLALEPPVVPQRLTPSGNTRLSPVDTVVITRQKPRCR